MSYSHSLNKTPGAILYLTVRGSNAYGTNIPTSDIDFAGVFIQSHDDILGNKYLEQINDSTNDTVIYELRRFLELCGTNNPNILELLNTPSDCIIYKMIYLIVYLSIEMIFLLRYVQVLLVVMQKLR
jgi:predicted nucleotidyltransferase